MLGPDLCYAIQIDPTLFSCVASLIRTPFLVKIESIKNEKRKHRTEGDVRMTKKVASTTRLIFPCSAIELSKAKHTAASRHRRRRTVRACAFGATIHGQTMMNVLTDG